MIQFVSGNIFNSKALALVNPVNCDGVMGKGLALTFKQKYPDNFEAYAKACRSGELTIGRIFPYQLDSGRYILNFPTKNRWQDPSRIEYIESGLADLVLFARKNNIQSLAVPPLGCGLGGLCWNLVLPQIEEAFDRESVLAIVYQPIVYRQQAGANAPKVIGVRKEAMWSETQIIHKGRQIYEMSGIPKHLVAKAGDRLKELKCDRISIDGNSIKFTAKKETVRYIKQKLSKVSA